MLCIYTYILPLLHMHKLKQEKLIKQTLFLCVCVCVRVQPAVQKSAFKPCQNIADPVS